MYKKIYILIHPVQIIIINLAREPLNTVGGTRQNGELQNVWAFFFFCPHGLNLNYSVF